MSDAPLIEAIGQLETDVRFRKWTRHRVKLIAVFVVLDLFASGASIAALIGVHNSQVYACEQANDLRRSYVAQWQPILDEPPAPLSANATDAERVRYDASLQTRARFQESLNTGFKQHEC